MKKVSIVVAFVATIAALVALDRSGPRYAVAQTAQNQKTLARKYDVINVKGTFLKGFQGTPIERLALLALRNGKLAFFRMSCSTAMPQSNS